MADKANHDTVTILPQSYCRECGWPIIHVCCNGSFNDFVATKRTGLWDWWYYCSNKGCTHHEGEGVFQSDPDWVVRLELGVG